LRAFAISLRSLDFDLIHDLRLSHKHDHRTRAMMRHRHVDASGPTSLGARTRLEVPCGGAGREFVQRPPLELFVAATFAAPRTITAAHSACRQQMTSAGALAF